MPVSLPPRPSRARDKLGSAGPSPHQRFTGVLSPGAAGSGATTRPDVEPPPGEESGRAREYRGIAPVRRRPPITPCTIRDRVESRVSAEAGGDSRDAPSCPAPAMVIVPAALPSDPVCVPPCWSWSCWREVGTGDTDLHERIGPFTVRVRARKRVKRATAAAATKGGVTDTGVMLSRTSATRSGSSAVVAQTRKGRPAARPGQQSHGSPGDAVAADNGAPVFPPDWRISTWRAP